VLAADPRKRATELWCLAYTPIWGAVAGIYMLRFAGGAGNVGFTTLAVVLWLGLVLSPLVIPPLRRHVVGDGPWWTSYHLRFQAFVGIWAVAGNWYSEFFYEMLGMEYGFPTTWNLNDVPFFLYLLTAVYFTTYFTIINLGWRWARSHAPGRLGAGLTLVAVCFVVAMLESAFNANPFIDELFCYPSIPWQLTYGSLFYGLWFVIGAPFWFPIDEDPADGPMSWGQVLLRAAASWFCVQAACEATRLVLGDWWDVLPYYRPGYIGLSSHPGFDAPATCLAES
jgi:cycloeucalenol cycloisomerase